MSLALADVARMRLLSQGLVDPLDSAAAAAAHLTCTQAQDFPGSRVSLALRTTGRSLAEVREAYDRGDIVRSWPMRGTLFAVAAPDLRWITGICAGGIVRADARRRSELGLDADLLDRAESVARSALVGGGLVRAAMLERWNEADIATDGGRGYHLLSYLAMTGVLCQGPTDGKEQRFVLLEEWIRDPRSLDRADGVRELLRRYITARGPVPLDDFCWWSKIGKVEARAALADLADDLAAAVDVDGREHWMTPDLPDRYAARRRATAAPLLLPGFDEVVLGYGDRAAVLSKAEEALVVPGGNGVFKGTVVHRGHAVGTWRRATRKGASVAVEPFGALRGPVERALPRLSARLPV